MTFGELQLQESAGRLPPWEADVTGEPLLVFLIPYPTRRLQSEFSAASLLTPDGIAQRKEHETTGTRWRAKKGVPLRCLHN